MNDKTKLKSSLRTLYGYRIAILLGAVFVVSSCLLIASLKQAHAHSTQHHILILNSYHKEFSWTDNQVSAAKEVFEKTFSELEIHIEYMDTKRIYNKEYLEYLYHIFRLKYADQKPDAIITTDDNALRFVLRYHKEVFGEAPVSFCGINDYNDSLLKGREQFTGLLEVLDIEPTIDLALKLHPGTRNIVVVVDSTPTGLGQLKAVKEISGQYKQLQFEYLEGKDLTNDELLEKLRKLPKDSICLLTVWLRDKNNEYLSSIQGGKLISSNSAVPVYGIIDMYYGQGIVGGKLLNSATHGRIAAEFAVRIMKGENPSAIPVLVESTNPYMFDCKQLERWKISKSDLPTGSIIINEPFSFYKKYKKIIWTVIIAFAILVIFIIALFINISRRKQSQSALRDEIGERKQVEVALREGEEKYRRLVENLGKEYFLYSQDTSGVFTYVSPSVTKMLGYGQEEFQKHFSEYLTDNPINEEVGIKSGQSIKGIRQPPYLLETYHKDGGSRLLEVNEVPILGVDGKVVSVEGIAHDLSERKMAEQERLRLSTAIEQAGEAIVITDIDGNIQYVNPAFRFITGYSDKEAIGQNPKILQSGKHSDSFYEQMWDTLMREQVWKGHFVNKKKDGSLYDEEATISPVKNTAGNICNFVAVKRDVTQEIQKEDQLRQAQKMESIGILAGGIAHDFNNILGAIVGYTELLIDDTPKSSPAQGYLNEILKSTGRANDLVKQILTFSRKTDQQNKPIKIIPIIKESLKLLRSTLPTTIEIRQRIDDFADVVIADPTQIHQIMMNLCTNASHAIQEENGLIDVQLTSATLTKNDLIGQKELKPGPYVKITVQDNGCGIDAANIDNIFDPFFTTKEVGRGTGMGLAVTHGIISNHDGFITVESSKAKGTTFDVFLPQAEIEAKQSEEYLEQIIKGTGNILFVDDEIALANIAKRMLSSLGYTVEVANDAFEALDIFNKDPARFDLVITDLTMPKMTGFNLAKRLFAIRANIPIILCSGFSESISEEDTKKIGIKAFVTKPLVTTKISKTIHAILSTQKE